MKKIFTIGLALALHISVFAASGIFQDYVILNINGGGNSYLAGGKNADNGALYTAASLGTPSSLILNGGEVKTFKNGADDIFGARIFYRVYKQGDTPGAYVEVNLPFDSNLGGGDQKWANTTANINILGLANSNGTWVLQVYWTAPFNFGTHQDGFYSNTFMVTALPVELTNFTAKTVGSTTQLNWATATEDNNDFFTIEKSFDGKRFSAIGTVDGAGTSILANQYYFTDKKLAQGLNYYRLKQTDFDGRFTFSEVVSVQYKSSTQATIFPNPVSEKLIITADVQEVVNIRIFNIQGQVVFQNTQRIENQTEISLENLASGTYFFILTQDLTQTVLYSGQLVKG